MKLKKHTNFEMTFPSKAIAKFIFTIGLFFSSLAFAGTPQLTYQGRLLTAAGAPVTSSVQFKLQIHSPGAEDCILYEEVQSQDLSSTSGVFALALNGSASTRTDGGSIPFSQIFSNRGVMTLGAGKCATGTTYSASALDSRNLKVYFNDGSGWESLPMQALNHVPMAVESTQVGGYPASSILRVDDGAGPLTASALTSANFTELISLITGVSTQYTKASSNGTTLIPTASSPSPLLAGQLWYDSGNLKFYNGSTSQILSVSGAAISSAQLPIGTSNSTVAAGDDSRIVNAIQNLGFAKSIQVGADASLPGTHTVGRFYVASDSQKIYYDNGTVWITVGQGSGATVTSASVTTALGYTPLRPSNNLSELSSSGTARINLGLGTAAVVDTGSASGNVPLLGLGGLSANQMCVANSSGTGIVCTSSIPSGSSGTVTSVSSANSYLTISNATSAATITANVGTSANTLAAGNDSRITGALQASNNLSDLASSATARTNLGLGSISLLNSVDLTSNVTGVLPAGNMSSANIITALGFTPAASGVTSSQWTTSGTTINYLTGNVGIGTATPSQALTVSGTIYSTSGGIKFPDGTTQTTAATGGASVTLSSVTTALGYTPLSPANNLSELSSTSGTARTNLGLGTAAILNAGTSANNLVQLDSGAKIPASLLPGTTVTTSTSIVGDVTGTLAATVISGLSRAKIASGTASHVLINDGTGYISSEAQLAISRGGTGASTATGARTALGLGTAAIVDTGSASGNVPLLGLGGLSANQMCVANSSGTGIVCTSSIPASQWTTSGTTVNYTTGYVGIGTTAPSQLLTVSGTVYSTSGGFKFPDGTTQTTAYTGGSSQWAANGSAVYSTGNVNVGNQSVRTTSTSRGQLNSTTSYYQTGTTSASVNWDLGNIQEVNGFICNGSNTITFTNFVDGGAYTLLLSGTAVHTGTCTFSASGLTFKTPAGAVAPTGSKDVLFTFIKIGSTVIYNMSDNLQ